MSKNNHWGVLNFKGTHEVENAVTTCLTCTNEYIEIPVYNVPLCTLTMQPVSGASEAVFGVCDLILKHHGSSFSSATETI